MACLIGRSARGVFLAVLLGSLAGLQALDLGNIRLSDPNASTNTVAFYANLMKLGDAPAFAFGRQGATDRGVGWFGTAPYSRSDLYDVIASLNGGTGDYDGVDGYFMEWVLAHTTIPGSSNPKPNYPGEPLYSVTLNPTVAKRVSGEILAAYARKQIIAIHAPLFNPDAEAGGGDAGNLTNPHPERGSLVSRCLPAGYGTNVVDGDLYPDLRDSLDCLAQLIHGDAGLGLTNLDHIPILFRPWPEWNFNAAYWYCVNQCSPAEFTNLWQFTVAYLRDVKGVHNLVHVWAPSLNIAASIGKPATAQSNYFLRWPGDSYVDVLAGDCYYAPTNRYYSNLVQMLPIMMTNSVAKNKVVALAEVGPGSGIMVAGTNRFWMNNFLRPALRDLGTNLSRIAYAMTWTSVSASSYFETWPEVGNTEQELEFFDFWKDPVTLFKSDLPNVYAGNSYAFAPAADAMVAASTPDANYGSATGLQVRTNANQCFLKFNVSGLAPTQTVVSVRLKLWSESVAQNVSVCRVADTNWTEGALTWNNQPAVGTALATVRAYANSQAVFNLPGAVPTNGSYAFALVGWSNVVGQFSSKESGTASQWPQLELVLVDTPSSNRWPRFSTNALVKGAAVLGFPYNAALAGNAADADAGDTLTFDKIIGPDWLTLSANGTLGGTPPTNGGTNAVVATIRVRDQAGAYDVAQLTIPLALPLTNAPPVLSNPAFTNSSRFKFTFSGDAGLTYTVQATTNLSVWTNLFSTNPATLPVLWTDTAATNLSRRFYRVIMSP